MTASRPPSLHRFVPFVALIAAAAVIAIAIFGKSRHAAQPKPPTTVVKTPDSARQPAVRRPGVIVPPSGAVGISGDTTAMGTTLVNPPTVRKPHGSFMDGVRDGMAAQRALRTKDGRDWRTKVRDLFKKIVGGASAPAK